MSVSNALTVWILIAGHERIKMSAAGDAKSSTAATNGGSANAAANELVRSWAHDLNCLSDESWGTRKRGLEGLKRSLTQLFAAAESDQSKVLFRRTDCVWIRGLIDPRVFV